MIVMSEDHGRKLLGEFVHYYNEERTHQALGPEPPVPGDVGPVIGTTVLSYPHLRGLHHSYRRAA